MVIIETSIFTRQVTAILTDQEYKGLQEALVSRPTLGDVIVGSGGLRKVRWSGQGRGKRGGTRVIYYWATRQDQLLMLFIYSKNQRDDLSQSQLKTLHRIIEIEYP